jgi:hypothetical protein
MAQSLSGVSVRTSIVATMAGQGTNVQNDIRIGRTLTIAPSTSEADIIYSVKFTSTAANDQLSWDLDLHKFTAAAGDNTTALDRTGHTFTGYASNGGTPSPPTDAVGDILPAASKIVAMHYETDSTNTGDIAILSTDNKFGDITLGYGDSLTRSALLVPRADPTNVNITITFAASGDDLTVLVLAKD